MKVKDNYLQFNNIDLKLLIDKYGTPLKMSFLPKIGWQINKAKKMFADAIKKINTKENIIIAIAPKAPILVLFWKKP